MTSLLLKAIINQLNHYIQSVREGAGSSDPDPVVLGNIASSKHAGGENATLSNKVVVTLVNVSEDSAIKNQSNGRYQNGQYISMYPVVHVYLYLLFASTYEAYDTAIDQLFRVMEFFQGRKVFRLNNAPIPTVNGVYAAGDIELTVDLHTLSFEQLNDLWGSLGGKQAPFVLYRLRLVPIQMEQVIAKESLITEIDLTLIP